jgi:hypothetical protein
MLVTHDPEVTAHTRRSIHSKDGLIVSGVAGRGAGPAGVTPWQPRTPAMVAGLTDHVWTLREVLLFRVPPWPQPVGV